MRHVALLLFSILAFAWWARAYAQADDVPEPVILTDEQDEYPLGMHLEVLEDPSGELTIEDVASPEFDSRFTPSRVEVPNFGFNDSAYWVRLSFRNETRHTEHWLLEAGSPNMQFVDLYTPLPSGEGFDLRRTGSLRSPASRDIRHPRMILNLDIPANSQQSAYVRFQSGSAMSLPLTLWLPDAFWLQSQVDQALHGSFFGALLVLLATNLFLLLSLREKSYLYLVIMLASMIVFESGYTGYTDIYILPRLYYLKQYFQAFSFALLFASMLLFTNAFLELKVHHPKVHWTSLAFVGAWVVLLFLTPFLSYRLVSNLMVPWALLTLVVVLSAGTLSLLGGFRSARFFMFAWSGLLATFIFAVLTRLGVIPSTVLGENLYRLGIVWMAVFWSIALADRVNLLKAKTEGARHRLSQILEGLPLGVVVYGKDFKPNYVNRRVTEILGNPTRGIDPDLSAGRTLAEAMEYYSIRVAGSDQEYPMKDMPIYRALQGEPASVDDAEADLVDRRVPLEIWASPVSDNVGNVESAVVAFQDITRRKQMDAELDEYRMNLERLVEEQTAELRAMEGILRQRIEWLSAFQEVSQATGGMADLPPAYETLSVRILQLLGARAVSILYWGEGDQLEVLCRLKGKEPICEVNRLSTPFLDDFPLREKIERGDLITLPVDQVSSLPALLCEWFQDQVSNSLLFAPMIARESVVGLLGLAMPQPDHEIIRAQTDLVKNLSLDLASLAEDAHLLDQARDLDVVKERNRLARELHDSVTQTLFTASVLAEATPLIWDKDPEIARADSERIGVLLRGALAEMRSLLLELRSDELYKKSLGQLLATLAESVRGQTRAVVTVSTKNEHELPENVSLAFYRIAREALNNVVKHAGATQIDISLLEESGQVEMCIKDDGSGFDPEAVPEDHLGISIMAERAAQVGGDLRIQSEAGRGTEVVVTWSGNGGETKEHG